MKIDSFLNFLFKHNTTIIEVLIASVLVLLVLVALRLFLSSKEPKDSSLSSGSLGDLEASLKKILEKAGGVPANSEVTAAVAAGNPEAKNLVEEINKLKEELGAKQKQVEELKSNSAQNTATAAPGLSASDKEKLEAQIKELQAKLSEYEIISEDIADLSFYKEQNAKLTKELENLKSGGGPAPEAAPVAAAVAAVVAEAAAPVVEAPPAPTPPAPVAAPVATPTPAPAAVAPAVEAAAPVAAATEAAPVVAEPTPAGAAEAPPAENLVDDNLLAEFNAAVESQKAAHPETAAAAPAAQPPPPATPPAAPAAPVAAPAPAAEESKVASETPTAKDEAADLGDMDMEKMMAEAASITANGPDVSAEEALGTALDEEKILKEANAIGKVSPEDKKLMGDFENFVKKGS